MTINEKNVEVGDFVRITNNYYSGLDFIVGNYYEVLVVHDNGVVGLIDGIGDDEDGCGWSFCQSEFDDVHKKNSQTFPSLTNKKIWVGDLTEDQKKRIQDVAFEQGYVWGGDTRYHINFDESIRAYYFDIFRKFQMEYDNNIDIDYFNNWTQEEITYDEIFGESEDSTTFEMPSRLVPMVKVLQERCQKANVQVITRKDSFVIQSTEDEREIVCNTEEELFDILDQLVTIQEMSEKIGWTV